MLTPMPKAPSNLKAKYESDDSITLTWEDNSDNEIGFEIEMTDGSAGGTATVGSNITTYKDTYPHHEEYTYSFKVRAKGTFGSSVWSNTVSVTPDPQSATDSSTGGSSGDSTNAEQTGLTFDGTQSSWAESELLKAYDFGLTYSNITNNYMKPINREEFCTIVVKLYEKLSGSTVTAGDNPFNDTDNPEIIKAYEIGIVKGKSVDTFAPYDNITRQEICIMIMRCLDKSVPDLDTSISAEFPFDDQSEIASWALESMKFSYKNGIMKGTGGGQISPKQNTTREQGIVLLKRTYEQYIY